MTNYHKFYKSWKSFVIKEAAEPVPNIELEDWVREQPWYLQRKQQYGEESAEAFAKFITAKQQGQPENVLNALQAAYKQADEKSMQAQKPQQQSAAGAQQPQQQDVTTEKWYQEQLKKYGKEAADAFAAIIRNPENAKDPQKYAALKANYMKAIGASPEQQADARKKAEAEADAAQARLDKQRSEHDQAMKDMMASHTANMNNLMKQAQDNTNAAVSALKGQQSGQAPQQVQETKTCPNCKQTILAGKKFCTKCGAPQQAAATQQNQAPQQVQETKTCPKCGNKLALNKKFCTKCGTPQQMPTGQQ